MRPVCVCVCVCMCARRINRCLLFWRLNQCVVSLSKMSPSYFFLGENHFSWFKNTLGFCGIWTNIFDLRVMFWHGHQRPFFFFLLLFFSVLLNVICVWSLFKTKLCQNKSVHFVNETERLKTFYPCVFAREFLQIKLPHFWFRPQGGSKLTSVVQHVYSNSKYTKIIKP